MSILGGTLITMAIQIGSSLYNQRKNRENLLELKRRQQEFKTQAQRNSLARDYEKFKSSCDYQRQIEEENHIERLKAIDQEFFNSFVKMAHDESLRKHYPLKISPFIIRKSVIPICGTQISHSRKELFCFLTNSNDQSFNRLVLPILDDMLCLALSSMWNQQSLHTVCYYSDVWNKDFLFCDENIDNLKSVIITPTIALTPFFERNRGHNTLVFKINIWGVESEITSEVRTPVVFEKIPNDYSKTDINNIIFTALPLLLCSLAQIIDVYYWANYYQPPLFPYLIERGQIRVDDQIKTSICADYANLYQALALGCYEGDNPAWLNNNAIIIDVTEINQCNFPNRSIGFLRSALQLSKAGTESSELIQRTTLSLYKARTGNEVGSLSEVDASCLDSADMDIISELAVIAKTSGNDIVFHELRDIISRKILLW